MASPLPSLTDIEYSARLGHFWTQTFQFFFFFSSTKDRIEDINRCMNSVTLMPIDITPSEFGEGFDPSTLDFENEYRGKKKNQ